MPMPGILAQIGVQFGNCSLLVKHLALGNRSSTLLAQSPYHNHVAVDILDVARHPGNCRPMKMYTGRFSLARVPSTYN